MIKILKQRSFFHSHLNVKIQQGFTLIELLIVTTILSLLMFTGSYTYSLFTNKWQDELGQFNQVNQQATSFHRIQTILTNIIPYAILKDDNQPAFFFIGGEDSLLAITHDGLFSTDAAEIFRLSTTKDANGKSSLLYQAKSLAMDNILTESQSVEFDHQLVLATQFDGITFNYYGWSSYQDKKNYNLENLVGEHQWYKNFSGLDKQLIPEKVEIILTKADKKMTILVNLDNNTERWLSSYFNEG